MCPTLEKFPPHDCDTSSGDGIVDAESKQERANQTVITPGCSPVNEVGIFCIQSALIVRKCF